MANLRCCTFNCRGWNSGYLYIKNFIDSLDICFIQEHWLLSDQLNKVRDVSPDFLSVGVSGVDCSALLEGRPYGGCSILYRKSLVPFITPLNVCSDRFCAIKLCDSDGLSSLLISVYMPGLHSHSPAIDYLNILSEISGFIDSCRCDVNIIVGDFNVDFDRRGLLCDLLTTFMSDMNLTACDLFFRQEIKYTYERDDTMARSWIDHVLCTQSFSSSLSDMYTIRAGSNLSDHFPLCFLLHTKCLAPPYSPQPSPSPASRYIIWSKATSTDLELYKESVRDHISPFPSEIFNCTHTKCFCHQALDRYAENLTTCLLNCAFECLPSSSSSTPRSLAAWNDADGPSKLKDDANFWFRVWEQAGCPSSGVLYEETQKEDTNPLFVI